MSETDRVNLIRDLMDRLDGAGVHFRESRRQALLGLRQVVAVLEELASERPDNAGDLKSVETALTMIRGGVDFLIGLIPELVDRQKGAAIQIEALGLFRDVLSAELLRVDPEADNDQREGLLTAIGLIDQEIESIVAGGQSDNRNEEPEHDDNIHWIKVER